MASLTAPRPPPRWPWLPVPRYIRGDLLDGAAGGREDLAERRGELTLSAEDFDGFAVPSVALLGQRSELVFGLAGLQGGLLGQCDRFDVGGLASVGGLELFGQFGGAGFDRLAPR